MTGVFLATCLLAGGIVSCDTTSAEDVAYEDAYGSDYYYPADVAVAGAYGAGWGYGLYYARSPDAGASGGLSNPGGGSVRSAVGTAIREAVSGVDVCGGNATFTRANSSSSAVCGISTTGFNLVFNGCTLAGGGTVDGTVAVQLTVTASDANCDSSTMLSVAYTQTITNLTYTGTGGAKIVIPTETDMGTLQSTLGSTPATISVMSTGEIQRIDGNGNTSSDRTFTGSRTFSSISFPNQSYTLDGMISFTDKSGGGSGTLSSSGLMHQQSCCKPVGGTLTLNLTGGSHSGTHTWAFSSTCGSATLDGKTVSLPACL